MSQYTFVREEVVVEGREVVSTVPSAATGATTVVDDADDDDDDDDEEDDADDDDDIGDGCGRELFNGVCHVDFDDDVARPKGN